VNPSWQNIGISLPGTGETPVAPVLWMAKKPSHSKGDNIAQEFSSYCGRVCAITLC